MGVTRLKLVPVLGRFNRFERLDQQCDVGFTATKTMAKGSWCLGGSNTGSQRTDTAICSQDYLMGEMIVRS